MPPRVCIGVGSIAVSTDDGSEALDELYRDHFAGLVRVAFLLTGSSAAAEDAVHEVSCESRVVPAASIIRRATCERPWSTSAARSIGARPAALCLSWPAITSFPTSCWRPAMLLARCRPDSVPRSCCATSYEIARILGCRPSTVISAGIIIDLGDAASAIQTPVVGIATFERLRGGEQTEVDEQAGSIVVVSGGWYMHLNIYDEITDALGPGASTIVFDSIVASEQVDDSGLPSFELRAPLRWATDTEIPLQMMVQYSRFVVRRGCSDLAVSCSPDLSLEVVPSDQVFAPSSAWLGNAVEITSRPPN